MISVSDLKRLANYDTPTICNALEMIDPDRRRFGFTRYDVRTHNLPRSPVVGIARTATMRSANPRAKTPRQVHQERLDYYRYMSEESEFPKVCVMQDIDGRLAGNGPFFGEFNTRVHLALGFDAIITDGSIRDLDNLPDEIFLMFDGLRPSHGFVHVVDYGNQVSVFGMDVTPESVVHADVHGAVSFGLKDVRRIADSAEKFIESERPVMKACKTGNLSFDELVRVYESRERS
jgi:regulator of RNase E activity RraA